MADAEEFLESFGPMAGIRQGVTYASAFEVLPLR
jgi:hypothetical protein